MSGKENRFLSCSNIEILQLHSEAIPTSGMPVLFYQSFASMLDINLLIAFFSDLGVVEVLLNMTIEVRPCSITIEIRVDRLIFVIND